MFTTHAVGWTGIRHIKSDDYSILIEAAMKEKGFAKSSLSFKKFAYETELTGYGHEQLIKTLVPPITRGNITDIYLIGGCDGTDPEREMYKDAMLSLPKSAVVITLGCGKFRLLGARK